MSMDLKIVGAGHLGIRLALLWKNKFPEAKIFLKTSRNDSKRSAKWESFGFYSLSVENENNSNRIKTPFVVFCAPPTKNPDYVKDIELSVKNDWMVDSDGSGTFVFTSSGGVYAENSGKLVDVNSDINSSSPRSIKLLAAEQVVLKNGGTVIRFGGLYTKTRGPHSFWLRGEKTEFSSNPNGLINLIHYDDSACCVLAALLKSPKQETERLFLASDGSPISRMDICIAALKCPIYEEKKLPTFNQNSNINGKKYDTSLVREKLEWAPKFKSFADFMSHQHKEQMNIDQFL